MMQLVGLISGLLSLAAIAWIVRRRPLLLFALFLLLFSWSWRLVSALFLEAFGPVYAIELMYEVGGTGATWVLASAIVLTLFILSSMLGANLARARETEPVAAPNAGRTLGDLMFWTSCLFLVALYADLLMRGVIPLLEGMERFDYTENVAGPLHKFLFEFGNLLMFGLGTFAIFPRLKGGDTDLRFVLILFVVFVYCVLTGHRFSAFLSFSAFFLLPRAAIHAFGVSQTVRRSLWRRIVLSAPLRVALIVAVAALVVGALINSYLNVRGFEPALAALSFGQRALVQPGQMWFLTYERVFLTDAWSLQKALEYLFVNPIDPDRATTIQYLMSLAIGEANAARTLGLGVVYNGGYPEVFFELFGPFWAWPAICAVTVCAGLLFRETLVAIRDGRILSAFAVMNVLYLFFLTYTSGMLNFLVTATFWTKVGIMLLVLLLERGAHGSSRPLLPWALTRAPALRAAQSTAAISR